MGGYGRQHSTQKGRRGSREPLSMVHSTRQKLCRPQNPVKAAAHRPVSQVGKPRELSSTVSTSHLEARKGQNELRGWAGKAANQPIWFLQLPPKTRAIWLGPSAPSTQEICRVPRGNTGLWVFQSQEHDSTQTPWMSALVPLSLFFFLIDIP